MCEDEQGSAERQTNQVSGRALADSKRTFVIPMRGIMREQDLNGWCGICLDKAGEKEPGYCDPDMEGSNQDDRYDEERTVVKVGKNWGYCSPTCDEMYDK